MNVEEMDKAIERLKKVNSTFTIDVGEAFMGYNRWTGKELRDVLVDVLMKARASWWANKGDLTELSDEYLEEVGLVRLPVDKDGEIIRPGDKVDLDGEAYEVRSIKAFINRDSSYYLVIMGNHCEFCLNPNALRHHREPTIKDVLREFLSAAEDAKRKGYDEVPDEAYVDCAEKLREVMDA